MNESTPLILTFDNGQQVSVTDAKSVVGARHQDRYSHCAIVRGQKGAAFCHPSEDVLVNGSQSSVHWLQPGDRIQFGNSATATVEQLGRLNDAINELKQAFAPAAEPLVPPSIDSQQLETPVAEQTVAEALLPAPVVETPAAVEATESPAPVTPEPNAPESTDPTATQEPLSDFAAQLLQSINDETPTDTFSVTDQPTETIAGFDATATVDSTTENPAITPDNQTSADTSDAPQPEVVTPEPEVNSSVSAILERMQSEGDWDGVPEEEAEASQPAEPAQPTAAVEAPPANQSNVECDDDVESYMSQLLTRMRGGEPAAERTVEKELPAETAAEETVEPAEPVQANPLKPEEFVPKTKARRADTWQQMRELSNISSQAAINSSDAKKKQESMGSLQTTIGASCAIAAFCIWATSLLGPLSAAIAIAIIISAGFILYKTFVLDAPGASTASVVVTVKQIPTEPSKAVEA